MWVILCAWLFARVIRFYDILTQFGVKFSVAYCLHNGVQILMNSNFNFHIHVFVFLSKGWLCVCQPQAGKQWSAVRVGEVINACGS